MRRRKSYSLSRMKSLKGNIEDSEMPFSKKSDSWSEMTPRLQLWKLKGSCLYRVFVLSKREVFNPHTPPVGYEEPLTIGICELEFPSRRRTSILLYGKASWQTVLKNTLRSRFLSSFNYYGYETCVGY